MQQQCILAPEELPKMAACDQHGQDTVSECSTLSSSVAGQDDDGSSTFGLEVESLIIFDWDDTLLPTSWLFNQQLMTPEAVPNPEQQSLLESLADRVWSTLQFALQLGRVVIVTNAEQGWAEASCRKFFPSVANLLDSIRIVSARASYQQFSKHPSEWKRLAFTEEVDFFYGADDTMQPRNILSVGDASHELFALKSVTADVPNCSGKSIKLLEGPTAEQLIEQHDVLSSSLLQVAEHNGDLDIEIDIEIGSECLA